MRKLRGAAMLFAAICLFAAHPRESAARLVDGVVAVVSGEPVTFSEFRESVAEMLGIPEGDADLYLREERDRGRILKGLENLIESVLVRQKLEQLGQGVSDREVEQAVESVRKNNGMTEEEFRAALAQEGLSPGAFGRRIRWQMERGAVVRALKLRAVTVTEEEVRSYFEENAERFLKGGEIRVEILFLPLPPGEEDGEHAVAARIAAQQAAEWIRAGMSFAEAARLVSGTVPGAAVMEPGFVKTEDMAPEIGREVQRLRTGGVSPPVFTGEGGFLVKVLERRGGTLPEFPSLKDALNEELLDRRSEKAYADILTELKQEATIDIRL